MDKILRPNLDLWNFLLLHFFCFGLLILVLGKCSAHCCFFGRAITRLDAAVTVEARTIAIDCCFLSRSGFFLLVLWIRHVQRGIERNSEVQDTLGRTAPNTQWRRDDFMLAVVNRIFARFGLSDILGGINLDLAHGLIFANIFFVHDLDHKLLTR